MAATGNRKTGNEIKTGMVLLIGSLVIICLICIGHIWYFSTCLWIMASVYCFCNNKCFIEYMQVHGQKACFGQHSNLAQK